MFVTARPQANPDAARDLFFHGLTTEYLHRYLELCQQQDRSSKADVLNLNLS